MPRLGHEDEDQDQTEHVADPGDDTDHSQQIQAEDDSVPAVIEEDERLAASDEGTDDADEVAGEQSTRRRESAKERRERARQAKERDKQEIDLLRRTVAKQNERLQEIDHRLTETRVTDIDERLATAINTAEQMDRVFGAAITAKNGDDARQAAKLRDEAKQLAWQLHNEKQEIIKRANAPAPTEPVPYAQMAVNFLKDKQWYNPKNGDEDSLVVEALDRALTKTMNPNDPNYWTTLDRKVKERLPHRFSQRNNENDDAQDDDEQGEPAPQSQRRKGPPTGGSNRSSGNGNRNPGQIVLPKEMVDAMKEAGQWDDPKVRARVAKRYHDGLKNRNG